MSSIAAPRPSLAALRIARLLRPAALELGAWISTEAAVQLPGHPLLRPAVLVVRGDPPYSGVATMTPLLVVEVAEEKVSRWLALRLPAVWGPQGEQVVEINDGARRIRAAGEHLVVPGHDTLRLAVKELLDDPPMADVIQLRR